MVCKRESCGGAGLFTVVDGEGTDDGIGDTEGVMVVDEVLPCGTTCCKFQFRASREVDENICA